MADIINTGLWVASIAILVFFISILTFIFGLTNWMAGHLKEDKEKVRWGKWFFFPSLGMMLFIFWLLFFPK